MAEVVGLASGALTLAAFAFKCTVELSDLVQSFQNHPKRVRDLLTELECLRGVLNSLQETMQGLPDVDFSVIKLPLLRCGKACDEFQQEIMRCSSRSNKDRTSFRDWAKLRYLGDDIDGFRQALGSYSLTINVAIADANLRQSTVAIETVGSYKELIKLATDDLEARLESIDERLEVLMEQATSVSEADDELQHTRDERLSTQKCLDVCSQLASHLEKAQFGQESGDAGFKDPKDWPTKVMNNGIEECKLSLAATAQKLEAHLKELVDRMVDKSRTSLASDEDIKDLARLRDEWATTLQCRAICSEADGHLKENISVVDNYATGDAVQFMVSTNNKTIHGSNRGLGWRTRQVGGHLSDDSVRQLSRDMAQLNSWTYRRDSPPPLASTSQETPDAHRDKAGPQYIERYGPGLSLASRIAR